METRVETSSPATARADPFGPLFTKWESTANAHDAKGWTSNFSKDAVLMPAGTPTPIHGQDGILKWAEAAVKIWNSLQLQRGRERVDGRRGWASGTFSGNVNMPDGTKMDVTGSYLSTLQNDGKEWKVDASIWNINLPQ
jgi:ketosteroid isomerase-like protein